MSTWKTYKRLLKEYAFHYKFKLFVGIFAGFLAGGSIFGILVQLEGVLAPFSKDTQVSKQVLTLKRYGEERQVIIEAIDINTKENIAVNKQDIVIKSEDYHEGAIDKIPTWIYPILEKIGISKEDVLRDSSGTAMLLAMVALFFFFIFKASMTFINRFYMRWVGLRVVTDLRQRLFKHIMEQSFSFHNKNDIGVLMSNINNDTSAVQAAISNTVAIITRAPVEISFAMGYILYVTIKLDLYSLFFLMFIGTPLSLLGIIILGKKMKKHVRKTFEQIASVISHMYEVLSCIRVVKAYHTEKQETENFKKLNENFFKSSTKVMKYEIAMTPLMELIGVTCLCLFFFICYLNGISFNIVFPIAIAANLAYTPLKQLSKINAQLQQTTVACERIFKLLDSKIILQQAENPRPLKSFQQAITFENVHFSYGTKKILHDINLTIPRGKFVAFVGEAGSGKSTIVNLISRFYDVNSGAIKIDGLNIKDINIKDLRDRVSFIDQVSLLFNETVRDNITYGSYGVSENDIIDVAKKVTAHQFIMENKQGYDFVVGEKGTKLSGGQRQRIAIARSLLKKSDILILDEATSSLDSVTEQEVQNTINELAGRQTVIAIAHRLSTVQNADIIYVMGGGCILDSGTHEQLIKRSGSYQDMWSIQFKEGE